MRMVSIALTGLLIALSACNDCSRQARGRVDIGTGETEFIPLDETTPTWDLVHGPQGGWHVLVGLDAAGMEATQIVVAQIVGTLGGEEVARNDSAWLTFQCNAETRSLQSWNTFLILNADDHCPLHEQELTVRVQIEDDRGKTADAETTAMIVDPEIASCE